MIFEWAVIGPVILGVTQLIALVGAYYGLKADNAKLRSDFLIGLLNERTDRLTGQAEMKADLQSVIGRVDTSIQDLQHRIATVETGQDEWTKALRQRTHELANDLHIISLKVDRLERPHAS